MAKAALFADVILPLALPNTLVYEIPLALKDAIEIGKRVVVPLATTKLYSGIVVAIHQNKPIGYEVRAIEDVLDTQPLVHQLQLDFWFWMSTYYMCTVGEVMNAALPSGFRLSSETRLVLHPDFKAEAKELNSDSLIVISGLENRNYLTLQEISSLVGRKNIHKLITKLIDEQVVIAEEELKERYKPKIEIFVQLAAPFDSNEEALGEAINALKSDKQLELMMWYMRESNAFSEREPRKIKRAELLRNDQFSTSVLNGLVKKGLLELVEEQTNRLTTKTADGKPKLELSPLQETKLQELHQVFEKQEVCVLHGVTGSGKTQLYVALIQEAIAAGKQVLYLLPEIALTTQIIGRLTLYFGNELHVYHSRFSANEKAEVWLSVLNHTSKGQLILGARSALFLPYSNLGLIIVDEEHDSSFKQFDPAPRYHARDAAVWLAYKSKAKVVLGSATPSLESYFNAEQNRYGLVTLSDRYGASNMPEIVPVKFAPTTKESFAKQVFTDELIAAINETVKRKKQVILFQNRRGFSPYLICEDCGWSAECTQCDVSLTYHKNKHKLKCHYCSSEYNFPPACKECGSVKLNLKGFGTEKIEEELEIIFPDAKIGRLDLDTAKGKNAHQRIIEQFEAGAFDILVGTQMVTKGLDFDHVHLVGILNADSLLHFPDFRAAERSFQLMTQVAGRAGRQKERGLVYIQTYKPKHDVIAMVIENDYLGMYNRNLQDRLEFFYPPYARLIKISLRHKEKETVDVAAVIMNQILKPVFGKWLIGPDYPLVARLRGSYHKEFLLKLDRNVNLSAAKNDLKKCLESFTANPDFRKIRVVIDVDPQ